jgi:hypothetical protein
VAIEFGICRSGRSGGVFGSVTGGNANRRGSAVFFWVLRGENRPLGDQESIGRDTQRDVVVEPAPSASFVMTQAKLLLEVLVVPFDPPA